MYYLYLKKAKKIGNSQCTGPSNSWLRPHPPQPNIAASQTALLNVSAKENHQVPLVHLSSITAIFKHRTIHHRTIRCPSNTSRVDPVWRTPPVVGNTNHYVLRCLVILPTAAGLPTTSAFDYRRIWNGNAFDSKSSSSALPSTPRIVPGPVRTSEQPRTSPQRCPV